MPQGSLHAEVHMHWKHDSESFSAHQQGNHECRLPCWNASKSSIRVSRSGRSIIRSGRSATRTWEPHEPWLQRRNELSDVLAHAMALNGQHERQAQGRKQGRQQKKLLRMNHGHGHMATRSAKASGMKLTEGRPRVQERRAGRLQEHRLYCATVRMGGRKQLPSSSENQQATNQGAVQAC